MQNLNAVDRTHVSSDTTPLSEWSLVHHANLKQLNTPRLQTRFSKLSI